MARGSGFGALGKNFIVVRNAQHRIFRLRLGNLVRSGAGLCRALVPMRRVVEEGPTIHCLAPMRIVQPQNRQDCDGLTFWNTEAVWQSKTIGLPQNFGNL